MQLHLSHSDCALAEALGVFAMESVRWFTAHLLTGQKKEGGQQGLGIGAVSHCWQLLEIILFANCLYRNTELALWGAGFCGRVELQFVTSVLWKCYLCFMEH